MTKFDVGDMVRKRPEGWTPHPEFDAWGRGQGVGVVVGMESDPRYVDVRWPAGRCWEHVDGLELFQDHGPLTPTEGM